MNKHHQRWASWVCRRERVVFVGVLLAMWMMPMLPVFGANPASVSRPAQRALWKRTVARVCGVSVRRLDKIHIYFPKQAGPTGSFALASYWMDRAKTMSRLVFVSRYRCKMGWCHSACLSLHEESCSARPKPSCFAQFRVLRLVDLKARETVVKPESGSWWEPVVPEPKTMARWPLLLIQQQILRDTGDKQRTQIHTMFLSLQSEQQPRIVMKLLTFERWPPILLPGRKQEPVGRRVYHLQFQQAPDQPMELTTIERPIPSPFDRCCQPLDTHKRYQLSAQGFEIVNDL